jgi:hypothetical protein
MWSSIVHGVAANSSSATAPSTAWKWAHVLGRCGVVLAPHDHRHEADLTVTDPAGLVFEVALGHDRGFAELAALAHRTVRMTVDL